MGLVRGCYDAKADGFLPGGLRSAAAGLLPAQLDPQGRASPWARLQRACPADGGSCSLPCPALPCLACPPTIPPPPNPRQAAPACTAA